ncbi:MAG: hypothetical protein Aurels2KO_25250 [Aureliella sp.]
MGNKYAKARPGQDLVISAGLYNDAVDFFGPGAGFNADRTFGAKPQGVVVKVKNTSGSDRSRWDCMSLGDTRFTIGDDGEESVVFEVETAASDKTPAILQEPIADNKFGDALIFGYTLARIKTASAATDLRGTPNATDHNLSASSDGPVQILAAPSTSADSLRPVIIGAAAALATGLAETPPGGIPGKTGSGTGADPWVWGSATCTVIDTVTGEKGADTLVIKNMVDSAIGGEEQIQWKAIGGTKFVDVEGC